MISSPCCVPIPLKERETGKIVGIPLEEIGNIPPAEAEEKYYAATAAMDNIPMAA